MKKTGMHEEINQMFDLGSKVAFVVGGSVNLGFDIASVLAAAGADLIITSRKLEQAQKTAELLSKKYEVEVLPLQLDHTNSAEVAKTVEKAHSWKDKIDILVNNAGGGGLTKEPDLFKRPPEDIRRLIEVNLTGTTYVCQKVGQIMVEQNSGKIINIASVSGLLGRDRRMYARNKINPAQVDYAAAKAGVLGLTRDLAALLSPQGIYVNAISPGGFNRNLPEGFVNDYSDRTPLGRMGRDGIDLKGAILFLASTASDYVTGHNLVVDGGFSLWH